MTTQPDTAPEPSLVDRLHAAQDAVLAGCIPAAMVEAGVTCWLKRTEAQTAGAPIVEHITGVLAAALSTCTVREERRWVLGEPGYPERRLVIATPWEEVSGE